MAEQIAAFFDSNVLQILREGLPRRLLKHPLHIARTGGKQLGNFYKRYGTGIILLHIFENGSEQ
ncbi:hypothetical protein KCTCHS21_45930 [Cohnella abietis]|uniref:Uncharacterized protein n=1 Tax=Cohnella abietis TaxID=2507935 RepID=A0A3T1DAY0_9BACL|nr:hypothetical protein KCTCHS21_45930 [Cohnella abietis]